EGSGSHPVEPRASNAAEPRAVPTAEPRPLSERTGVLDAFIALLVRALDLDRLLFLLDDGTGRAMRCVGRYGPVPGDPVPAGGIPAGGPWCAIFPIASSGRIAGQLLLGR